MLAIIDGTSLFSRLKPKVSSIACHPLHVCASVCAYVRVDVCMCVCLPVCVCVCVLIQ